jgi:hypothetical protein
MSNVSDTNEIVAVRLLFPLARTFLMGCMSIRFLDFHQPHDRRTSRPIRLASENLGAVGTPLSAPEIRSQAAERPETMHIGKNG